eukprot:CAMPEP_0119122244 /NCGR_PEP_ID=MMETSP1310-20130426/2563_1 /TAXON_ID=464262 /ORGANISM="Genus nov. species nov., Strain RCC2339" /LENGTH=165 /DNA_ID=CAMNT_0007111871 /DNA_START=86 /DNA_END=579 /DNA_ORIENTATION=-
MAAKYYSSEENPRGIPAALFIENVDNFIGDQDIDTILKELNEIYQKYKFMEQAKQQSRMKLKQKIPEIAKALEMTELLMEKRDENEALITTFELSDNLYANASVKSPQTVALWLGANTMLEYPIEEAHALLNTNIKTAKENLKITEEDVEFLHDQVTTSEVNIAR